MEKPKQDKLGQILLQNKIISEDQLAEALEKQQASGKSLGRVLIEMKMVIEGALTAILAQQIGMKYVDLGNFQVDISATALIDADTARKYSIIPISFDDGKLLVAMADPTNVFALDDIRIMTNMEVEPAVSTKDDIVSAINRYCRTDTNIDMGDAGLSR